MKINQSAKKPVSKVDLLRRQISEDTFKIVEHVVNEKINSLSEELISVKKLLKMVITENRQLKTQIDEKLSGIIVETENPTLNKILNTKPVKATQQIKEVVSNSRPGQTRTQQKAGNGDLISSLGLEDFNPDAQPDVQSRLLSDSIGDILAEDYSRFVQPELEQPNFNQLPQQRSSTASSGRYRNLLPSITDAGKMDL